MNIDILGREYEILIVDVDDDEMLKKDDLDGYYNADDAKIVIRKKDKPEHMNCAVRHELIHAFLFESGLGFNWEHNTMLGHDETFIDWFAIQYPKIKKVFDSLDVES